MKTYGLVWILLLLVLDQTAAGQMRIRSAATGGNWSCSCTWEGGIVPDIVDTVEIINGSTVVIDSAGFGTTKSAGIYVSGTLQFGVNEPLIVDGDLVINSVGILNAFNGATGALVTVNGSLINNGTVNFSKTGCILSMGESSTATYIKGTGTYGVLRQLTINNSKNVVLSNAVSISSKLELLKGIFYNTGTLTFDQTNIGSGTASASCTIQRSAQSSLSNAIVVPAAAVLYVSYNGTDGDGSITEGFEIPGSRAIHKLIVNHPDGVQINNDLTLKTSSAAITLTAGVVSVASGKTLICNNSGFPGTVGNYNSYVAGGVALIVNSTGGTKTFPVGAAGRNRKVVLNGLSAASGTLLVRFAVVPANGGTGVDAIALNDTRRFYGSILSGSLGKFTGMSVDYWEDDQLLQQTAIIAASSTLGGQYTNIGTGTNNPGVVISATGVYNTGTTATLPAYYALATVGTQGQGMMIGKEVTGPVVNDMAPQKGISLRIYPNPVPDEFFVKATGLKGKQARLIITAVDGRIFYRETVDVTELQTGHAVNLKNLRIAPGIYFLQVIAEGSANTARFLVL